MKPSSTPFNPSPLYRKADTAARDVALPHLPLLGVLPHNQQLLEFIQRHQPISVADLWATFDGAGDQTKPFLARLNYLKNKHWLLSSGYGAEAVLTFNSARPANPFSRKAKADRAAARGAEAPNPALRVQPRQITVMSGHYQPAPPPAQRPGSDDHTRLPSLRQRQRIPFVPGYIFY